LAVEDHPSAERARYTVHLSFTSGVSSYTNAVGGPNLTPQPLARCSHRPAFEKDPNGQPGHGTSQGVRPASLRLDGDYLFAELQARHIKAAFSKRERPLLLRGSTWSSVKSFHDNGLPHEVQRRALDVFQRSRRCSAVKVRWTSFLAKRQTQAPQDGFPSLLLVVFV
jgi:hypothetical protein